jgi:hypothetical protein
MKMMPFAKAIPAGWSTGMYGTGFAGIVPVVVRVPSAARVTTATVP